MKKILLSISLIFAGLFAGAQSFRGAMYADPEQKLCDDYCSSLFKSAVGTVLTVADQPVGGYLNILDWLQGRVAGLQIYQTRNQVRIPVIRGAVATVFIDEMRVDPEVLNSISVYDIALIKVIKTPFIGSPGANSAIAIYTL